jgi:hypothetical protein
VSVHDHVDDIALPAGERTVERWFNTDAGFNKVANQQLVSNVRTSPLRFGEVRSVPINNVDLSLIKNTRIASNKTLQLRFESLNAFNHPLFPAPNADPTAAAFGRISAPRRTTTRAERR